jgi:hypothetical protein
VVHSGGEENQHSKADIDSTDPRSDSLGWRRLAGVCTPPGAVLAPASRRATAATPIDRDTSMFTIHASRLPPSLTLTGYLWTWRLRITVSVQY